MPPPNESDSNSNLPRYLRKDPMKQRQSVASRFNFSWIGGMAQQLRSALKRENRTEIQNVRRQSEHAQRYRESELFARESKLATEASTEDADAKGATVVDNEARDPEKSTGDSDASHSSEDEPEGEDEDAHKSADEVEADVDDLDADLDDDYDEEDFITQPYETHAAHDLLSPDHKQQSTIAESGPALQDFGAEDLDAEDLDAEDLDAEDLDAEMLDAEELEAPAEGSGRAAEHDTVDTDRQNEVASDDDDLRNEDSFAPVDPSDHEAHEYDPELSSMSLWEGTGFQSYDSAMDVEYDKSEHEEEAQSDADSDRDVERESKESTSGAPFAHALDSEPPVELDRGSAEPKEVLNISSPHQPVSGSRLEPSKRFVGFHFGPAQTLTAKPTASIQSAGAKLGAIKQTTISKSETESAVSNGTKDDDPIPDDAVSEINQHAKLDAENGDVSQQNNIHLEEPSEENPYAGLWNLFNVGFTVAPQTNPVKGRRPSERAPNDPSHKTAEPEVSLDEEFHLLAQTAHRVMAGSTLFGGAPATPVKPPSSTQMPSLSPPSREDRDPALFNKRVSGIAQSLFSNSPLFGGKTEQSSPISEVEHKKETVPNEETSAQVLNVAAPTENESSSHEEQDSSIARQITNNEVEKKQNEKRQAEDEVKCAVKRRRLRKNAVKEEAPEGSDEPADALTDSNEPSIDTNESADVKKRKRTGRTRPLTRAALRAQRQQKESEGQAADSEDEPETSAEPSKKKRRSAQKGVQKTGSARTNRRRP